MCIPPFFAVRYSPAVQCLLGIHSTRQVYLTSTIRDLAQIYINPDAEGQISIPKPMNFWESSERPLTPPPPSFSVNHVTYFATKMRDYATKVHMFIMAGLLYIT